MVTYVLVSVNSRNRIRCHFRTTSSWADRVYSARQVFQASRDRRGSRGDVERATAALRKVPRIFCAHRKDSAQCVLAYSRIFMAISLLWMLCLRIWRVSR
jgi:hypothetical protein